VLPKGQQFGTLAYPIMLKAFGSDGINKMMPFVIENAANATTEFWTGQSFTEKIRQTFDSDGKIWQAKQDPGNLQAFLENYYVWVMSSVDVDAPNTFDPFLKSVFDRIFIRAAVSAGLDSTKVMAAAATSGGGTVEKAATPGGVLSGGLFGSMTAQSAQYFGIAIVVVFAVVVFFMMKKS